MDKARQINKIDNPKSFTKLAIFIKLDVIVVITPQFHRNHYKEANHVVLTITSIKTTLI